ncbi:bifunctional diguanylate cyclase/phosphodiesterase [Flexibacterium corallicola]|uniref:bifunctional diguanylate cyclase/phosphodiesterase n=1 Tax=Flexibacterium corallicola TaxID=3037259 RepID=UPI00286F3B56|nr:EAL domain-containing protein [Pseudovibrio sp. M1P-2-3]
MGRTVIRPFSSLSFKLALISVLSMTLAFVLTMVIVVYQLDANLEKQTRQIEIISKEQFTSFLERDIRHVNSHIRTAIENYSDRVLEIAARGDIQAALWQSNPTNIKRLLRTAASFAGLDNLVIVNENGKVLGYSSFSVSAQVAQSAFDQSPFTQEDLKSLLAAKVSKAPPVKTIFLPASQARGILPPSRSSGLSVISATPMVGSSGSKRAVLIGQSWLRPGNTNLYTLSNSEKVGVAIFDSSSEVMETNFKAQINASSPILNNGQLFHSNGVFALCGAGPDFLRVCTSRPDSILLEVQNRLEQVAETSKRDTLNQLLILGGFASSVILLGSLLLARHVAGPLQRLTETVSEIAGGNYSRQVTGIRRGDEVGDIARSVQVLQKRSQERASLRQKVGEKTSQLEKREQELSRQNLYFDAAINNMSHGLVMVDQNRNVIVANDALSKLFNLQEGVVRPGMQWAAVLKGIKEKASSTSDCEQWDQEEFWSSTRRTMQSFDLKGGIVVFATREPLGDGGWVTIFEDVSERSRAAERMEYLATHDAMTGLLNRYSYQKALIERVHFSEQYEKSFGVLILDLDEFKTINDTLGHGVGDDVLKRVAKLLQGLVTGNETVARLGGDEFAILIEPPVSVRTLEGLAVKIIDAISTPFKIQGNELRLSTSIGLVACEGGGLEPDKIMRDVDLALYEAKGMGRDTFRFFKEDLREKVEYRHALILDLQNAVTFEEFEVYFQPQVSFSTNEIVGFEALMRWRHPLRGFVPPSEFIPIAEETGMMSYLGEWVLRESCLYAIRWPNHVQLAVNVSPKQLESDNFLLIMHQVLKETGFPASRLELEITESVVLDEGYETKMRLHALKKMGIKIALDDFGTGYSSLSSLRSFPFDRIKIDRSFIKSMFDSQDSQSILNTIFELGRNLRIATLAEGIEDARTVEALRDLGCDIGQGYFYGKPVPQALALAALNAYKRKKA